MNDNRAFMNSIRRFWPTLINLDTTGEETEYEIAQNFAWTIMLMNESEQLVSFLDRMYGDVSDRSAFIACCQDILALVEPELGAYGDTMNLMCFEGANKDNGARWIRDYNQFHTRDGRRHSILIDAVKRMVIWLNIKKQAKDPQQYTALQLLLHQLSTIDIIYTIDSKGYAAPFKGDIVENDRLSGLINQIEIHLLDASISQMVILRKSLKKIINIDFDHLLKIKFKVENRESHITCLHSEFSYLKFSGLLKADYDVVRSPSFSFWDELKKHLTCRKKWALEAYNVINAVIEESKTPEVNSIIWSENSDNSAVDESESSNESVIIKPILHLRQIAMLYYYEGKNIKNPAYASEVAMAFNYRSKTSGRDLFEFWVNDANPDSIRKVRSKRQASSLIKAIEEILPRLSSSQADKAREDIGIIRKHMTREY